MHARFPLYPLVAIIVALGVINAFALYYHLYFYLWWLDIPMHFFGGLWIGLFTLTWYYRSSFRKQRDTSTLFVVALAVATTMTIGLAWELFELSAQTFIERSDVHDLSDTLADLTNDLIGALVATGIFIRGRYNA